MSALPKLSYDRYWEALLDRREVAMREAGFDCITGCFGASVKTKVYAHVRDGDSKVALCGEQVRGSVDWRNGDRAKCIRGAFPCRECAQKVGYQG